MEDATRLQNEVFPKGVPSFDVDPSSLRSFLPAILAIVGSFVMVGLRIQIGERFISDTALMMLALAAYILGALFELTNLYAPSNMAKRLGLWGAALGVFFNFSSWLVRWVTAYDHELAQLQASGNTVKPWIFRYVPFANLYDLSIAFAFGAGITTLLLIHRKNFQFLSAFTLPLAAIILTLARFIGGEHSNLMPILDSYWRPIHVGVASLSYGIALVCFAIAVIYLLKDGVKVEAMAIWSSIFALCVFGSISGFSVFTSGAYRAGTFVPNPMGGKPFNAFFRVEIPYVGWVLLAASLLLAGAIAMFLIYHYKADIKAKSIGHVLLKLSLVAQILAVGLWVTGVKSTTDINARMQAQLEKDPAQYVAVGRELASRENLSPQEFAALTTKQLEMAGRQHFQQSGAKLFTSLNTNPVEFAGVLTALAGTFFVILFSFKTETVKDRLPSLDALDSLMYKTACLAFAGLAMLLITGAIWANESWGRPWGFDSKETGALVAWLTYAAFLHTRISRGWKGRSSAYFAIIGFLLVIFTYLGVSYLLPGLHSYA